MKPIRYFRFSELVKTSTKHKNCPSTFDIVINLIRLVIVLEKLREEFDAPIIINSGYRCPEVNSLVGGVVNSLHLQGRAADITCNPLDFDRLVKLCKKYRFDGQFCEFKLYTNYIHVAV